MAFDDPAAAAAAYEQRRESSGGSVEDAIVLSLPQLVGKERLEASSERRWRDLADEAELLREALPGAESVETLEAGLEHFDVHRSRVEDVLDVLVALEDRGPEAWPVEEARFEASARALLVHVFPWLRFRWPAPRRRHALTQALRVEADVGLEAELGLLLTSLGMPRAAESFVIPESGAVSKEESLAVQDPRRAHAACRVYCLLGEETAARGPGERLRSASITPRPL